MRITRLLIVGAFVLLTSSCAILSREQQQVIANAQETIKEAAKAIKIKGCDLETASDIIKTNSDLTIKAVGAKPAQETQP